MYLESTLLFLVASYLFETYLDWRQYVRFLTSRKRPSEIEEYIDEKAFEAAQEYGAAKISFGFLVSAFDFTQSFLILWYGGITWLWVRSTAIVEWADYSPENTILVSCVFIVIYQTASTILHLPFSVYSTFVLEAKYGFNKTTARTFILDQVKSMGLFLVLGLPIFSGALYVIEWGGKNFYLYIWLFMVGVSFVMLALYPTIIAPLFNTFTELTAGPVADGIKVIAARVGFPLGAMYVKDGSTRSSHSNAYMYGFGLSCCGGLGVYRIVVFDTLIEQLKENPDGVVGIVGHEMGHYKMSHNLKNMILSQAYLFVLFYTFSFMIHNNDLYTSFGFPAALGHPPFVGLFFFSLAIGPLDSLISFARNFMSRSMEYEADAFAIDLNLELKAPLAAILGENKGNMDPDWLYSIYHHTHPTLVERLRAIRKLEAKKK